VQVLRPRNARPCPSGYFSQSIGAIGKSSCFGSGTGNYAAGPGAITNEACGGGTYQTKNVAGSCRNCPAGTWHNRSKQSSKLKCIDADNGRYVPANGAASQTACAAGTYNANTGKTACTSAVAGKYVSSVGAKSQTTCPVGTYSTNAKSSACTSCSPGTKGKSPHKCKTGKNWKKSAQACK